MQVIDEQPSVHIHDGGVLCARSGGDRARVSLVTRIVFDALQDLA